MVLTSKWTDYNFNSIVELYGSVGWTRYTKSKEKLRQALLNSTYVVISVHDNGEIVGLARSISDGAYIHYLQDVLVRPGYQGRGIGKALLENVLDRFKHVRTHMLLTDDDEKQLSFYTSLGYKNTKDLPLNAFIRMNDVT